MGRVYFGIIEENFCTKISLLPKENYIPEISFILNQIRKFSGTEASAKLFFKSKVDEISALLLRRTENIQKAEHSVFSADHAAIMQTIEFINKNLHKRLPLETLAKMSCMSGIRSAQGSPSPNSSRVPDRKSTV